MKNEGTTKKEEEELLLRETKKTLQKELALFKKKKILTSEELIKMKETSQMWDERLNMKKKHTPLEMLQFPLWMDKWRQARTIVESMIIHVKPGPWDQSLKELEGFNIDVQSLLLQILRLKKERDNEITESRVMITELKAIIKDKDRLIEGKEYIIKLQEGNLKLQKEIIQHYEDCNEDTWRGDSVKCTQQEHFIDQTDGPLRIVFNKNLN